MTHVHDCPDCGRTKLADEFFECCSCNQDIEIISPDQVEIELRAALGDCYTALAFELENAIKRQDEMAIIQIESAQNKALIALKRTNVRRIARMMAYHKNTEKKS